MIGLISCVKSKANKSANNSKALESQTLNDVKLIVLALEADTNEAKALVDNAKNENEKVAILLIAQNDKITITAGVKNAPIKAGAWVKQVAQLLGGNGGGRDDFATAGGKDSSKIAEALALATDIATNALT